MKKIQLQIDELILHGFSYHDHRRISIEIEKELTKLIISKSLQQSDYASSYHISSINIKNIPKYSSPKKIGSAAAKSIYFEVSKPRR